MAAQSIVIQIDSPTNDLVRMGILPIQDPHIRLSRLGNLFSAIRCGSINARVGLITPDAAVKASGTLTCASVIAGNSITIAGVTLAAHASVQDGTHFVVGTNNATAANLATCIGANTTLNKLVGATANAAVVTVAALQPGLIGNALSLVQIGGTITPSGAALAGGAGDLSAVLHFGY